MRISWVIPMVSPGSGGMRNILRFAYFLQELGHQVSLYVHDCLVPPSEIASVIRQHFYDFKGFVASYSGEVHRCDVLFATHWSTVAAVLRNRERAKIAAYFVQDFEPAFSPLGSEYVLAENTYRQGLYHVTSGPYCEKLLKESYNAAADHFRFPLDRSNYWPRKKQNRAKSLIFFARPEMPRRCFELGCMVLHRVKQAMPDLEIVTYGSAAVEQQMLSFEARCLGILPGLDDLAQLYSDSTAGLVFSLTNPSLVPYEMMACGLPVIDIRFHDNIMNYDGRDDIALLAPPDVEGMTEAIVGLLNDDEARRRRSAAGLRFAATFPNEIESVRRVEKLLLDRLATFATA